MIDPDLSAKIVESVSVAMKQMRRILALIGHENENATLEQDPDHKILSISDRPKQEDKQ